MRIWVLHARRRGLLRCGVGLVLMKLKLQKQMRKTQQTIANKSQEARKEVASWPNLPSNLATFSKAKTGCCSCIIIIKRIKPTSTNFKWPNLDNSKHNNLFIILFKWINKTLKMLTTCSRSEFYINKSTFVLFPPPCKSMTSTKHDWSTDQQQTHCCALSQSGTFTGTDTHTHCKCKNNIT